MTFRKYQKKAWKTAVYPMSGNNAYYPTLGLCGEAGEVAENMKKCYRDDQSVITPARKEALKKELGDVLWYVGAICTEVGLDMECVAECNLEKLQSRQERGVLGGSGDDR